MLKSEAELGSFNAIDDNIVGLNFVPTLQADASTKDQPTQVRSSSNNGGENSAGVVIGAGVGAVVVLGALVFFRRRHSRMSDESADLQPSTVSYTA